MCQSRWRSPLSLTLRRVVLLHPGEEGKRWGLSEVSSSSKRSLNKVVVVKVVVKVVLWFVAESKTKTREVPPSPERHMDFFFPLLPQNENLKP